MRMVVKVGSSTLSHGTGNLNIRRMESLIDAGCALSGCGPAYVDLFIEAMADAGVSCGLSREKSLTYACQTLIGDDDVTVFESFGLESTFANFIFGIITSGFYKVAKSYEKGFLNPSQYETVLVIEEANKVLTGNDTAGTGGKDSVTLSGQPEFEEILDQAAGYGLFIVAITQKISEMPSSIVANCGMFFLGKISHPDDVNLAVRMIGREERIDDRDVVKWLPKSPTGWFICRSNRGYDFRDAEPVLVQIEPLNNASISNAELNEILTMKEIDKALEKSA